MPSQRIPKQLNTDQAYFLTFTIKDFHYLFDKFDRWTILSDSLKYFQDNRQLNLHAFVFMLNHIHLIVDSPDVIGFVRDFKKFTSKRLKESIIENEPMILKSFINNEGKFSLWCKTNMPKVIYSEKFYFQKLSYIENNPVKKKYVVDAKHWYWSSANKECSLRVNRFNLQN